MRPTFRKLEVKDVGELERLVAENVEGIEPGLKVIDSRLLLGQAAVDLVGLDSQGALVLIALDFTADEGLLLRVMDAYSWCLEYPDTIRRLYPVAQVAHNRPPRILFIVERLTDSFVRRVKQLSFLEIDCLEFRHLEVNGASALYFDLVQRLRRADTPSEARVVAESRTNQTPAAPQVASPRVARITEIVPAQPEAIQVAPVAVPAPAPVVVPAPAPLVERIEAVVLPPQAPELAAPAPDPPISDAVPEPPAPESAAVPTTPSASMGAEPEVAAETADQAEMVRPVVGVASNPEWQALLNELGVAMPRPGDLAVPEPEIAEAPHSQAAAAVVAEVPAEPAPTPSAPPAPAPVQRPAWAKPADKPVAGAAGGRTYFFAQAVKGGTPAAAPAPARAAAPVPAPAAPPAPANDEQAKTVAPPPELESINFPKDGLSRQWLEFLNQLSATK